MNVIETLGVKLGADASEMDEVFKKALLGMAQFQREADRVGSQVTNVGQWVKSLIPAAIVTNSIRDYSQQESAIIEMTAALGRQGKEIDVILPKMRLFSEVIQKHTQFADEYVLSQMAYGMNLGISADNIEDVTKAAIGLSRIMRTDLSTGMMMITRAGFGHTEMLRRYGINLSDDLSKTEKFNALIQKGLEAYPLAEKEAGSLTNQMTRMKNAVSELNESFGEMIVNQFKLPEKIEATRHALERLQKVMADAPPGVKSAMGWTAAAAVAIPPAMKTVGQGIRDVQSISLAAGYATRGAGQIYSNMATTGRSIGMVARGTMTAEGMTKAGMLGSLMGIGTGGAAVTGAAKAGTLLPFLGMLGLTAGAAVVGGGVGYGAGTLLNKGMNKVGIGSESIGTKLGNWWAGKGDEEYYAKGEAAKKARLEYFAKGGKADVADTSLMPEEAKKNYAAQQQALSDLEKEATKKITEMMWDFSYGLSQPAEHVGMLKSKLVALRTELDGLDKTSDKYLSTLSEVNKIQLDLNKAQEEERKGKLSFRETLMQSLMGSNVVGLADKMGLLKNRRNELLEERKKADGAGKFAIDEQLLKLSQQAAGLIDKGEGGAKRYSGAMVYGSAESVHGELAGKTTDAKLEKNTGDMVKLLTTSSRLQEQTLAVMQGKAEASDLGDFIWGP